MFSRYFQQELTYLRELGSEFSGKYPALAPMLSESSSDPDVERLLEGVAFLTAQIREKLDDEFPEIIHELVQLIWPHYLRPIPPCSIVKFSPKPALKQSLTVKTGVQLASVPVENTTCLFRTCYDTELHPLVLNGAQFIEPPGKPPAIALDFELKGLALATWQRDKLRFYLGGSYRDASLLYMLLRREVRRVLVQSGDEKTELVLGPESIRPVGFTPLESVIPYPSNSFAPYRALQEFFIFPQKFLFLDLVGLDKWTSGSTDSRFRILFEFGARPTSRPPMGDHSFELFATPVINLFGFEADPIRVDHRKSEYRIRPSSPHQDHYQIYDVQEVVGYIQGSAQERKYNHFNCFSADAKAAVYQLSLKNSPVRSGADTYLQLSYPRVADMPVSETISLQLTCTNGDLPENIRVGDITQATSSSPEFASFTNIARPTAGVYPPLGKNLLWRLLAHLNLNNVSLADGESLKALLNVYLFPDTKDRTGLLANEKRIQGIEQVTAQPSHRLVSGLVLRGQDISVRARSDHFDGEGDFYLFGCVLDEFFALYSSINSYTRYSMTDTLKGELYQWRARTGEHPLI